jgi:hypothetical protein
VNHHGYLLEPDDIDAAAAGRPITAEPSALDDEGRFLGGSTTTSSVCDVTRFRGEEWTERRGRRVYELTYRGGLVVP